eukprot:gene14230-biopygen23104
MRCVPGYAIFPYITRCVSHHTIAQCVGRGVHSAGGSGGAQRGGHRGGSKFGLQGVQ